MASPPAELRAVFCEALDRVTPQERADYLDNVCQERPEFRGRVEALLRAHEEATGFFQGPSVARADAAREPSHEGPGSVLGAYKLLEQIGEGGFGLVYLAEQQQPVRRKVAVKILKPGMDSRQVVARFQAERQALALMEHANIAKVLDAGEASSGRPYFVMELCRGVPITDYSDQNALAPRDRLELFVTVCQAVQHAHLKGIIHRDIKPTNVLVALHDGAPVVKVIDFGIAKALGQKLTNATLWTEPGLLMGTPSYMSPEQMDLGGLDIDTRTDVYSLGVLLYELLTGLTPYDKKRLREADFDELRRIIREEEPPRPSTRLTTLAQAEATTVSERRRSDPRQLSRLFRGELDWIVMKALEKDRARRYETASAFAADVQRYLRDEAVLACPPSRWYRFRKFAGRKRGPLAMVAVVALALLLVVAGLGGSFGWAVRDQEARDTVAARERETRETALDGEVTRALDEAVALIDEGRWPEAGTPVQRGEKLLVAAGHPQLPLRLQEMQRDLALLTRLDHIREEAAGKKDSYYTEAEVLRVNAEFTRSFQEYGIDVTVLPVAEAAERIQTRCTRLELAAALDYWSTKRKFVDAAACGIDSMNHSKRTGMTLNQATLEYGLRHPDRVRTEWERLLKIAKVVDPDPWRNRLRDVFISQTDHYELAALKALAASAPVRELRPSTLLMLGHGLVEAGDREVALALLRKAQSTYPSDVWLNEELGWVYFMSGQPARRDESVRFYGSAVAVRPHSAYLHCSLGFMLTAKSAYMDAIAEFSTAIALDPKYRNAWLQRGRAYAALGRPEAIADLSQAIYLDPNELRSWVDRGDAYKRLCEWDKAIADYSHVLNGSSKEGFLHFQRAQVYGVLGQWDKAADDMDLAVEAYPDFDNWWMLLAAARAAGGDNDGYRKACRGMHAQLGQTTNPTVARRIALSCLLVSDAAIDVKVAAQLAEFGVKGAPNDVWCTIARGVALYRMGQFDPAVQQLQSVVKTWPEDPYAGTAVVGEPVITWLILAMANQRLGQNEEARRFLDKAVNRMDKETSTKEIALLRQQPDIWAMCLVLRREAEELVKAAGPSQPAKEEKCN